MAGYTITGTSRSVLLSNPATQNPATVVAGAYVTNTTTRYQGDAVYGGSAAAWNFTNLGKINTPGADAAGVFLSAGGIVTNGAPATTSALISGTPAGVEITGSTGTVTNFGTISATAFAGVYLRAGGIVTNGAAGTTSALISGSRGISLLGTVGTVTNFGTIQGTGTDDLGILLDSSTGASLSNGSHALISGEQIGILLDSSTGVSTVSNSGTIQGTETNTNSTGIFQVSYSGASIGNAAGALISGEDYGIRMWAGVSTVSNSGTIRGAGTYSDGIYLGPKGGATLAGASISNASGGLISGGDGILINSVAGTVVNYGDVVATATTGVGIKLSFGTVTNFGAVVAGTNGTGIDLTSGRVTNFGMIAAPSATAVYVRYGTFINFGLVEGRVTGVELSLGTGSAGSGQVTVSGTVIGATGISVAPGVTASQTVTVGGAVMGTSGTAVALAGGLGRLIVDPGAMFTGMLNGGKGSSVLEIAASPSRNRARWRGAGRRPPPVYLSGVTDFSVLQMDAGAVADSSGPPQL